MFATVLVGAIFAAACSSEMSGDERACQILLDPSIIKDVEGSALPAKFEEYADFAEDRELAEYLRKSADYLTQGVGDQTQLYLMQAGQRCVDLGHGTP